MATNLATAKRGGKVNVQGGNRPIKRAGGGNDPKTGSRKVYPTGHAKEALNANLPASTLEKARIGDSDRVPTPQNVLPEAPQAPTTPVVTPTAPPPVSTSTAAPTPKQTAITTPQQTTDGQLRPGESFEQYNDRMSKFRQGLAAAQASGAAPQDPGAARTAVSALTPNVPDTTATDALLSADPAIGTLMSGISTLLNSKNQTTTLMQDYKKLRRDSGLDDINEELIDAETVIDGTEDDIRNEIQMAGGIGTESQVQAMTLARNKGLLKRYNQLVQMKTDATNQLNTMMQLNAQDKQMAQQRVDSQINAMFNMANFRQNALNAARSQYQWLAQTDPIGFYNSMSQDPRQMAMAEKILGTGPGGLKGFADQKIEEKRILEEERQFARQMQQAQLELSRQSVAISAQSARNSAALGWANLAENKRQFDAQNAGGGNQELLGLLNQYKTAVQDSNWFTRTFNPEKSAEINTLKAQITAQYKEQEKLGTLDAGLQTLINDTLGGGGITGFSTKAQVKAIDVFTENQGGNPYENYKKALGL